MENINEKNKDTLTQKKICEGDEYYREIRQLTGAYKNVDFYPEFGKNSWKCSCGRENPNDVDTCPDCTMPSSRLNLFFSELFLIQRRSENEARRIAEEKRRVEEEAEKWRAIDPEIENTYLAAKNFEKTKANYFAAAEKLDKIKGYRDAEALAAEYRVLAESAPIYGKKELAERKNKKIKKAVGIALIAAAIAFVIYVICYFTLIGPNGFKYEIIDGEVTITGYDQFFGGKDVVIPSEMFGKPVTVIGNRAFYDCDVIRSVVIPDSVKKIDSGAFSECDGIEKIVIPRSVTEIKSTTFSYCDSLREVEIYADAKNLPMFMFRDCKALTNIIIDMPSLESAESNAFDKCTEIKVVRFSGSREDFEKIFKSGNGTLKQAAIIYDYKK